MLDSANNIIPLDHNIFYFVDLLYLIAAIVIVRGVI